MRYSKKIWVQAEQDSMESELKHLAQYEIIRDVSKHDLLAFSPWILNAEPGEFIIYSDGNSYTIVYAADEIDDFRDPSKSISLH